MMRIRALLKLICVVFSYLTTTFLWAQDSIRIIEELPANSEKLEIILPRTIWFNTSKVKIGNYGVAKIKEGITVTDAKRKKGVTYSETKFKFSIVLTDSENNSATLQARTVKNDTYVIDRNSLLNDISDILDIGVESETISSMVFYPKTLTAKIFSDSKGSGNWDFVLKTSDENSLLNTEIGNLTDGERNINVVRTNLDGKNINENGEIIVKTLFYEFLENGISLGAVTFDDENSIWLKPGLDSTTKLILCTAMLSIAY